MLNKHDRFIQYVALALTIASTIFSAGCATGSKAPSLDTDKLAAAKFKTLKPKTIRILVKNYRPVNIKAKNTAEVEQAVAKSLEDAFAKNGIKLSKTSPNLLGIQIHDYTGPGADGECIKINGRLQGAHGGSITAESHACHNLKHAFGFSMGGSVSEAYERALGMMLDYLDKNSSGYHASGPEL